MSMVSISISDDLLAAAERAVAAGRFATVSEYVAALISADQSWDEQPDAQVESLLAARARSGAVIEATDETFDRIRDRLEAEIAKRHKP